MPVECDLNGWWPPGCGLVSQANDNVLGAVTSLFANILQNMASWLWAFITGAFTVSNVDDSQWLSVEGLTSWWVIVMLTPLVVVMILQVLSGLVSQQPRRIGRAMIGGAAAIPLVGAAVYLVRQLTRASDLASAALLESIGSDPYLVFMRLFGFERAPEGSGREWNLVSLAPGTTGGPAGAVVVTAMAVIVVWILAFILMCSMIFRSFALVVLAAVAPVALMLLPWDKTKSWARRWCEVVIALVVAKPLAGTVLAVAVKLFAESESFAGLAAGTVGMALACGAPLMALRLVSFAGGELAAAAQTAGGGHVLSRSSSVAARQISRQTGGRLTLAGLVNRSTMTRPISSSRSLFPTQVLAPAVRSGMPSPQSDGGQLALRTSPSNGGPNTLHPPGSQQGLVRIDPHENSGTAPASARQAPLGDVEPRAHPNASPPAPSRVRPPKPHPPRIDPPNGGNPYV
ncbi:type IV secretion system protein [Pseudarthrobacter sp. J75]|uniref:type IV secretion system protein n=1 Tax=unclassified Pseudarthrobacter TaxID=2647000 RepID=UPI002E7FBBBA|nr:MULTISPECIES: type IV secretion system protein [unclassified Pseudarthrobacter]MEE2523821.1 type IV secretion system protein [Pseudarthrobacter sp. J47]MEE2530251.1 type IV secretion system protein [Pseudarthrobacter sp. J75]